MSWKNSLLTGISHIFTSSKNEVQDPKRPRLLIVSTTGLGDSLWGTPAIRALKAHFPESYLGVLTSCIGSELYHHNPHIDKIFTMTNFALPSYRKILFSLKKNRFEIACIFHLSQRLILPLISLSSPSQIIGTKGINKGLDSLLTKGMEKKDQHAIERRLEIVQSIGAPPKGSQMEIFLTSEEKIKMQKFLKGTSFPVGIHPGAKDRFKQWNPIHFANLGKRLQKEYGAQIFITGNHSERELAQTVADLIPEAQSVAGKFSIRLTAALIEQLKIFLTNDTGPMHIAYAMNTPTFSLFVPTDSSLCGSYQISHASCIQKKPTCSPCLGKQCQDPFCLEQISESDSWSKIKELLQIQSE